MCVFPGRGGRVVTELFLSGFTASYYSRLTDMNVFYVICSCTILAYMIEFRVQRLVCDVSSERSMWWVRISGENTVTNLVTIIILWTKQYWYERQVSAYSLQCTWNLVLMHILLQLDHKNRLFVRLYHCYIVSSGEINIFAPDKLEHHTFSLS